ncbi:MAG: S-methyl-5'-thioadenosine phosphorylase [Anaerolineaceae bacterium]|nr:S-methyl-5'-thioadenosine phosphorylase [Anaerolineaceae bacterium]
MKKTPILGVIGGSGLYGLEGLEDTQTIDIDTPFGSPSSPIMLGTLSGKRIAFLARHGIGHFLTPGEVNYRANIYALKSLGLHHVVSVSAVGSLREDYIPGQIVIPDQIFDFTKDRERSFFGEGMVGHIGVADPFCAFLSGSLFEAVTRTGAEVHRAGTILTIEGPRFSTRAESNAYRSWGMSLVGMTACPEAFLAREAELCYAVMAHVTDYDVWHTSEEEVSVEMVLRTMQNNTAYAQQAMRNLIEDWEAPADCSCQHTLKNAIMTQPDKIPAETRQKLDLLVRKYL